MRGHDGLPFRPFLVFFLCSPPPCSPRLRGVFAFLIMPIYEYFNPANGERVEARRSVDARDTPPLPGFLRLAVPTRLGYVARAATLEGPSMRDGVLAGYHRLECREGSRFRSAFSKARIAAAWRRG